MGTYISILVGVSPMGVLIVGSVRNQLSSFFMAARNIETCSSGWVWDFLYGIIFAKTIFVQEKAR